MSLGRPPGHRGHGPQRDEDEGHERHGRQASGEGQDEHDGQCEDGHGLHDLHAIDRVFGLRPGKRPLRSRRHQNGSMSKALTRVQVDALAADLRALLDQIEGGHLDATTAMQYRLQGAVAVLAVVQGLSPRFETGLDD